jgi:hypothetical protein
MAINGKAAVAGGCFIGWMVKVLDNWYCVSAHGNVLVYAAVHPDCTIKELTGAIFLTPRTILGLVGELRRAAMLDVRRDGRKNH